MALSGVLGPNIFALVELPLVQVPVHEVHVRLSAVRLLDREELRKNVRGDRGVRAVEDLQRPVPAALLLAALHLRYLSVTAVRWMQVLGTRTRFITGFT